MKLAQDATQNVANTALTLQSGDLKAIIRPEIGGCIEGLWCGPHAVLQANTLAHSTGPLQQARYSASYPLIPFSNRVAHATLQWNGTSHPLIKNFSPEEHAIHGVGWMQAWQVLDSSDDFCMLSLEHRADSAWPFAFDASQVIRLHGDALELIMSITNQSATPAPAGLGWHPFFVKRPGAQLRFAAQGMWEMSAEKLPTHLSASTGLQQSCDALMVDNCFEGWAGQVDLTDDVMQVQITSDMRRLVVYTTPQRKLIAIEPVSHANNAMNAPAPDSLGVRVLEPGQSWQVSMQIRMQPIKAV